jgi:hypothetical protein
VSARKTAAPIQSDRRREAATALIRVLFEGLDREERKLLAEHVRLSLSSTLLEAYLAEEAP